MVSAEFAHSDTLLHDFKQDFAPDAGEIALLNSSVVLKDSELGDNKS